MYSFFIRSFLCFYSDEINKNFNGLFSIIRKLSILGRERDVCGLDMARDRLQAFRLVPLELPQVEGKFMQEPFEGRREKINNFQDENSLDGGSIKLYLFLCWLLVKQNEKKA